MILLHLFESSCRYSSHYIWKVQLRSIDMHEVQPWFGSRYMILNLIPLPSNNQMKSTIYSSRICTCVYFANICGDEFGMSSWRRSVINLLQRDYLSRTLWKWRLFQLADCTSITLLKYCMYANCLLDDCAYPPPSVLKLEQIVDSISVPAPRLYFVYSINKEWWWIEHDIPLSLSSYKSNNARFSLG